MIWQFSACVALLVAALGLPSTHAQRWEAQEIAAKVGNVCYAVTTADVNGDGKLDIVAVTEEAVVWFENPSWKQQDIIRGKTERDNVCIAAHDIDGDGRVDFALGAGWRPPDTTKPGTLQWLGRDTAGAWQVHAIRYEQPSLHRIQWMKLKGQDGKSLVVVPLQGKGTKGPNWGEGNGAKVELLAIPEDPTSPDWPSQVVRDDLHAVHGFAVLNDTDVLFAAWEGVFWSGYQGLNSWEGAKLGEGNQLSLPNKGASEIKLGRLKHGPAYIATVEPWHGHQVAAYFAANPIHTGERPFPMFETERTWTRHVLAEPLQWGHAVCCADIDADGDDELIIGQRDPNSAGAASQGPGVFVFDPVYESGSKPAFTRHTVDDGGMACEDLLVADLDGDGRPEIVAGGRATHNVKIYWNR
jgi:hypothetical protein